MRATGGGAGFGVALLSLLLGFVLVPSVAAPLAREDPWRDPVHVGRTWFMEWDVAMVGHGRAVAAWTRGNWVYARLRVPGRGWLPVRRVAHWNDPGFGLPPSVAMNRRGAVILVYANEHTVRSVRRTPDGPWQAPRRLMGVRRAFAHLEVALAPGGVATAVVAKNPDQDLWMSAWVTRSGPDSGWSRPRRLGRTKTEEPAVVAGPGGAVTAAWSCRRHSACVIEHRARRWTNRNLIPVDGPVELAVDGRGTVFSVGSRAVYSHRPGRRWKAERIRRPEDGFYREIAASGRGRAVVGIAVYDQDAQSYFVSAAVRKPGGSWRRSPPLPDLAVNAEVSIAANGMAVLVGSDQFNVDDVQVTRFIPHRGWTPTRILGRGTNARVTSSPHRDTLLFFERSGLLARFRPAP